MPIRTDRKAVGRGSYADEPGDGFTTEIFSGNKFN
jgi:hypothetical protein